MCNDYRSHVDVPTLADFFDSANVKLLYPEGIPNLEPRDDIRITERGPIVRAAETPGAVELVQRRWSWPGPGGKPVYNFRSDGRDFPRGRCLIVADGFYEFTAHSDPKSKRKHKWLFTLKGESWFAIAGLWRLDQQVGEAFTMLTCPPGDDIAPYHSRQICVLSPAEAMRWLDPAVSAREVLRSLPAGKLEVEKLA
jgi:putative SOS response-associated peptidase YedK